MAPLHFRVRQKDWVPFHLSGGSWPKLSFRSRGLILGFALLSCQPTLLANEWDIQTVSLANLQQGLLGIDGTPTHLGLSSKASSFATSYLSKGEAPANHVNLAKAFLLVGHEGFLSVSKWVFLNEGGPPLQKKRHLFLLVSFDLVLLGFSKSETGLLSFQSTTWGSL